jgi:hypothetical protein
VYMHDHTSHIQLGKCTTMLTKAELTECFRCFLEKESDRLLFLFINLQERQAFFTQRKKCLTVKQQNDAFHKSCVDKLASLQRVRHRREDEE